MKKEPKNIMPVWKLNYFAEIPGLAMENIVVCVVVVVDVF